MINSVGFTGRSLGAFVLGVAMLGSAVACGKDDDGRGGGSDDGGEGGEGGEGGAVRTGGSVSGGTGSGGEDSTGGAATGGASGGASGAATTGGTSHAGAGGIDPAGAGGVGHVDAGAGGDDPMGTGGAAQAGAGGSARGGNGGGDDDGDAGEGGVPGGAGALAAGGDGGAGGAPDPRPPVWHWENPLPSGWSVDALWGSSADDVYAVGAYGNLLHWDGLAWSEAFVGDQGDYHDVWGSSAGDIHVVGRSLDQVLHFDGTAWDAELNPAGLPLQAVWGTSATNVWAVGGRYWSGSTQGVIVQYDGDVWSVARSDFTVILTAVWGSGPSDVFIGGEAGTVLHFDGSTYTPLTGVTGSITEIVGGGAADDVLLFDDAGYWYRYDRSGAEVVLGGQLAAAHDAWATSPSDVWVAAGTDGIQHFDGNTWAAATLPASADSYDFRAVWGGTDGTLFGGGWGEGGWDSAALVRRSSDEWVDDSAFLTGQEFRDVWALSPTLAYASGDGGALARWDGLAWSLVDLGTTSSLYGVWAASPDFVVVCERSDTLYLFDGTTWTPTIVAGATGLRHVRGSSATDVYVLGGNFGAPELYHFDGSSWTPSSLPPTLRYADDLWVDSTTQTVVIGGSTTESDTGVFVKAPSDASWTQLATPLFAAVRTVGGTSMNDLYAATDSAIYHHDGSQWGHAVDNPTSGYFTSLWAHAADDVWAVGYDSVILHYDGLAWSVVQNRESGWELFAVHGSASDDVLVVGESGTILRYGPVD